MIFIFMNIFTTNSLIHFCDKPTLRSCNFNAASINDNNPNSRYKADFRNCVCSIKWTWICSARICELITYIISIGGN